MKQLQVLKGNQVLNYLNGLTKLRDILAITTTPKRYAVIHYDADVVTTNKLERTIKAIVNNCPKITKEDIIILDVKSYRDMILNELTNK